jgi:hypothetical protein
MNACVSSSMKGLLKVAAAIVLVTATYGSFSQEVVDDVGPVDELVPIDLPEEELNGSGEGGEMAAASGAGGSSEAPGSSVGASADGQLPNGLMNFHTDLFTGRFSYQVPVIVPPARQGAQPKIALSYNSGGGNGWCGVGWSLELGYIQRETKHGVPIRWGTTLPLQEYDDSKGFVFNLGGVSATLVRVSSPGTVEEYRAEIDSAFLKFILRRDLNRWEVYDKNGTYHQFGVSGASRMEKPGWPAGVPTAGSRGQCRREKG